MSSFPIKSGCWALTYVHRRAAWHPWVTGCWCNWPGARGAAPWIYGSFWTHALCSQWAEEVCKCQNLGLPLLSQQILRRKSQPDLPVQPLDGGIMSRIIAFICIPPSIFYADVQTVTMETQQCLGNPARRVTAAAMWTPPRPGTVTQSPGNAWSASGTQMAPTVRGVPTGSMGMQWLQKTAAVSVQAWSQVHS